MSGTSHDSGWEGVLRGAMRLAVVASLLIPAHALGAENAPAQPLPKLPSWAMARGGPIGTGIDLRTFAPPTVRRTATPGHNRFYRGHFLPRITRQLGEVVTIPTTLEAEQGFTESVLFDHVSESARYRAARGTRKALKNYLIESTAFGRGVSSIDLKKTGRSNGAVRFGVGLSHGLPRVDLRYRSSVGTLRFRVGVLGSLGLDFNRSEHKHLAVAYDPRDDEYHLGCRLRF